MLRIENITQEMEERKSKVNKTKDLIKSLFEDACINVVSTSISVSENRNPIPFLYIDSSSDEILLEIPEYKVHDYKDKTVFFAEQYDKMFKPENDVLLKLNYIK